MASVRLVSLILVTVIAAAACAGTYAGGLEYTVGSGSNEATIVVDFDASESFLFSYKWDGTATAWDALDWIDQAGALVISSIDYGGSFGVFVSDFDYPGGSEYDYGAGVNTGWAYYISSDNLNWSVSMEGVSTRSLTNGIWESWVWSNYPADWSAPIRTPGARPIPEPCTIMLLGLGGVFFGRRRAYAV